MKIRNLTKTVLVALLAAAIFFSSVTVVSAVDFKRTDLLATNLENLDLNDADDPIYPIIILPGLSFSKYYVKDENGNRIKDSEGNEMYSGSFIVDKTALVDKLKSAILPLIKSIFTQSDRGLSDKVFDLITYFTQYELCDENGDSIYEIDLETYDYPMSEMDAETKQYYYDNVPLKELTRLIGEENVYMFTYCPFGEVMEQSQRLQDYVKMVLEQTGAEKVNIMTMSMGTTLLDGFLDLEGSESLYSNINRIVNFVPIFDGNEVITELLAKDFSTNPDFYNCDFLPTITSGILGNKALGYMLNFVVRVLPEDVRMDCIYALYDGLANAFKYSSQAWTMVQSERYQELRNVYLLGDSHDGLRTNTDRFFEAQSRVEEHLIDLYENYGVGVYNIVGYGTSSEASVSSLFSVIKSNAETNSDCLVPVSSSSLGAVYVSRNSQLSEEYLNSLETQDYVSPDKTIDASTCYFRDTTWFFHNQIHWCGGNDAAVNIGCLVLIGVIKDINTDSENYPQFNGTRDTSDATNKYMYLAEEVIKNADEYDPAKIADVKEAFDKMYDIYRDSDFYYNDNAAKEAADAQYNLGVALSKLGVCDRPEFKISTPVLEMIFKTLTDNFLRKNK